jgi:hypothetical protein
MADGAPADFPGPVLPNPKDLKPVLDTDIERPSDKPAGGKFSTDNAKPVYSIANSPAGDKANGVTPHPIQIHFQKKGGPIRRLHSAPQDITEH